MPVQQRPVPLLSFALIPGIGVLKEKKDKKEEVNVIASKRPVQRINSVPRNNPPQLTVHIENRSFVFEVDSGARNNFCSTQTWTMLLVGAESA